MPVCQYFLNNCCKFGSKCRNLHTYDDRRNQHTYDDRRNPNTYEDRRNPNTYDDRRNPNTYDDRRNPNTYEDRRNPNKYEDQYNRYDSRNNAQNKPSGVSVLQRNKYVLNQTPKESIPNMNHHFQEIIKDINSAESIWPATSYSYLVSHGNLQGFEDVSPEEMRLEAYEAQYNNTFQQYLSNVNNLKSNITELKNNFLNKTPVACEILTDYLKNGPTKLKEYMEVKSPGLNSSGGFFSGTKGTTSTGFSSIPKKSVSFNLGDQSSFRDQPQSSPFTSNIFAQALKDNSNSFPLSKSSSPFMSNSFGQAPHISSEQQMSVFGEPMQESSVFKQNIFGNVIQSKSTNENNITAKQASQSSSQFSFSNTDYRSSIKTSGKCLIYSNIDELTPEELEQFKGTTFAYGRTPLCCPPREYC